MRCPYCQHEDTRVVNSRPSTDRTSIRRRRACDKCQGRFTTHEVVERIVKHVIKRDGKQARYSREQLLKGVRLACKNCDVTEQQIEQLANEVEREAFDEANTPAQTSEIGKLVLRKLKGLSEVAYLRFASVHKEFRKVEDFRAALEEFGGGGGGK